ETLPRVRIPLSPPNFALAHLAERDVFRPARGSRRDSARIPDAAQISLSLIWRSETSSGRRAALAATRLESRTLRKFRSRSFGGARRLQAGARLSPRLGSNPGRCAKL